MATNSLNLPGMGTRIPAQNAQNGGHKTEGTQGRHQTGTPKNSEVRRFIAVPFLCTDNVQTRLLMLRDHANIELTRFFNLGAAGIRGREPRPLAVCLTDSRISKNPRYPFHDEQPKNDT